MGKYITGAEWIKSVLLSRFSVMARRQTCIAGGNWLGNNMVVVAIDIVLLC
jgi:hypothetical protein